jgi:hypothetical protein
MMILLILFAPRPVTVSRRIQKGYLSRVYAHRETGYEANLRLPRIFAERSATTVFMAMDFLLLYYPHVTTTRRASDLHRDAFRNSYFQLTSWSCEAFFFVQT